MSYQDRDSAIQEEIKRLERLQRLAEKVHRETKRIDLKLDELETRIVEEGRRADRLHPLDAKHNDDQLINWRLSYVCLKILFSHYLLMYKNSEKDDMCRRPSYKRGNFFKLDLLIKLLNLYTLFFLNN